MVDVESKMMLCRMLAAYEAPWAPIRQKWDRAAAVCARRRGDVKLVVGGGRESVRQAQTRQRDKLAAERLITGMDLTSKGKKLARAAVWPWKRSELRNALKRLVAAIERGDTLEHETESLVPELIICGAYWGTQVSSLQMLFLPLLADRILISLSDPSGSVYYGINHGAQLKIESVIRSVGRASDFDTDLNDIYLVEYRRCRAEMLGDGRRYSELGELPVGLQELRSGRDQTDASGIKPLFPASEDGADG